MTLDDADRVTSPGLDAQGLAALRRELVRAVHRVCPQSLAADAEDLVQESIIRLFRAGKLERDGILSAAYLKKVAYSAVIDEIRRRRRRIALVPEGDTEIESAVDEASSAPPDTTLGNAMEICMQRLEENRRRALTLHLLGYSGAEVASMLACNAKRAENLTLRGLAQLRECLRCQGLSP